MLIMVLLEIQGRAKRLLWPPLASMVLAVETGSSGALDKNIQHRTWPGLTPISPSFQEMGNKVPGFCGSLAQISIC